jgi:predicted ATP-dependent endonuclease of OLD family
MKLKKVTIHKYKSIETEQFFRVNDNTTVLVGMNESGKTAILEAVAKSNYFQDDKKFKYDTTHDYPRREKKTLDKSGDNPLALTCIYTISEDLRKKIAEDLGEGVFTQEEITVSNKFSNTKIWTGVSSDKTKFIENKTKELGISSKTLNEKLVAVKDAAGLDAVINEYKGEDMKTALQSLKKYFSNQWKWSMDPLNEYIARVHLTANLPKFLYYDEYYALPSRISIEKLQQDELEEEELKTAKALFDLADINMEEIINADNYEDFKAELEATQASITDTLFKYWETNRNLEIEFNIDKIEEKKERKITNPATNQPMPVPDVRIVEHVLDIRVKNRRSRVSLPLKNRSKGFNWFFSFLVWFLKIQEDKKSNYILLLDEPGLNLHASAQANLLSFLSDLSKHYQIIYTTHSPFMIESDALHKVRTVVETNEVGSVISDSIQEKDPNTLFPLQAALGYDIAQNLFISKNNLLVEGPADLIYLTILSNILEIEGREHLEENITIVPVGGLDKVTTFISLLRGSKLNVACLLDTFTDQKGKQRVDDLIQHKIIKDKHIRFFDEFANNGKQVADIEDLFDKEEYLKLFNAAFNKEYAKIKASDLDNSLDTIVKQINKAIGKDRFNHYRPANKLNQMGVDGKYFSAKTLDNFENMFAEINKLF